MAADAESLRAQAKRIKELRKVKERVGGEAVSQETAAHEIGVSVRTYRTWEGSGATIQFGHLRALAAYYDTSPRYIECGVERDETPDLSPPESEMRQLANAITALDEQVRLHRAESAVRDAEVLKQIELLRQTSRRPLSPPRA